MDERSSSAGALKAYRDKRDFDVTPEPAAGGKPNEKERAFVIQKHWARGCTTTSASNWMAR